MFNNQELKQGEDQIGMDSFEHNDSEKVFKIILYFFIAVSVFYIGIVPLFLFFSNPFYFYFIVSYGQMLYVSNLGILTGIFLGPISIIGGILGLVSIILIRKNKIIGLITLTILVGIALLLAVLSWSYFIFPQWYFYSSTL